MTTRRRTSCRILGFLGTMALAAPAHLATTITVTAEPIGYSLSGATATFAGALSGTDTLTGTFTYDPSLINLDAIDIVVTGPVFPTTITTPLSAEIITGTITAFSTTASDGYNWILEFSPPLNAHTPSPLSFVDINNVGLGSTSVTGDAVPAPEPTSLAVLGAVLCLFFLTRRADRSVLKA
jgi:hypothetical protein